jgi:HEPN domain-containing protein
MKALTAEWLAHASDDLATAERILDDAALTGIVAFHAQQTFEKCCKALLEEAGRPVPRTHDLVRLTQLLPVDEVPILDDALMVELSTLYVEVRYPGGFGLLPTGKPSVADARRYAEAAAQFLTMVRQRLSLV